jgi:hypothetical protein
MNTPDVATLFDRSKNRHGAESRQALPTPIGIETEGTASPSRRAPFRALGLAIRVDFAGALRVAQTHSPAG